MASNAPTAPLPRMPDETVALLNQMDEVISAVIACRYLEARRLFDLVLFQTGQTAAALVALVAEFRPETAQTQLKQLEERIPEIEALLAAGAFLYLVFAILGWMCLFFCHVSVLSVGHSGQRRRSRARVVSWLSNVWHHHSLSTGATRKLHYRSHGG